MTIGILLCGEIPSTLEAEFGGYSAMIRRLLGPRTATVFDVQKGQLPASTSTCEAYVITGSNAGVYDDLPWIKDLMAFLRSARGGSKLVLPQNRHIRRKEITRVQCIVPQKLKRRSMQIIGAGLRHGIEHRTHHASIFGAE